MEVERFIECLRAAQAGLAEACTIIDLSVDEEFAPPGKGYLLARIETALDIIEMELPECQSAIVAHIGGDDDESDV